MKLAAITLVWGDGEYPFALNIGQVRELEAIKQTGIGAIYQRLISGAWYGDDAYHVIRLALIGGGMTPTDALQKCQTYVLDRPFNESIPIALAIVMHRFVGIDEKKDQVSETAETPLTE